MMLAAGVLLIALGAALAVFVLLPPRAPGD